MNSLADQHIDYDLATLSEQDLAKDPFEQFAAWFAQAEKADVVEPNAMLLATVGPDNRPSQRTVLLKSYDQDGFVFFTNYNSRKGKDLFHNRYASLLFFWPKLQRQIRIEGQAQTVSDEESDNYYAIRPTQSKIGAWASPQSSVIQDRDELEELVAKAQKDLGDDPKRPPYWGGFRVNPDLFEFWQGRPSRLHDRLRYELQGDNWHIDRLAP